MKVQVKENLSLFQKRACIAVDGIMTLFLGVFLLIVGLDITVYDFDKIIYFSLLLFFGMAMTINAFIQKNSLLLWIGVFFSVSSIYGFLAQGISGVSYRELYPIIIAAPAISSLFTLFMSKEWKRHIYISLFFAVISLLFSLESGGILSLFIVLPVAIMAIGLIILVALFIKGEKNGK